MKTARSLASSPSPIPVFLSYSHRDGTWKEDLKRALGSLSQNSHITIWDDRKIPAGTAWEREIEQHLLEARIVLLLVTEDYVNSEWCRKECTMARSDPARRVIPLFVKRVGLAEGDPILALQGLPRDVNWADDWPATEQNKPRALIADGVLEEVYRLRHSAEPEPRAAPQAAVPIAASRLDLKFVDRETQEREFNDFWDVASWSRPGTAQIYVLPAAEIDCPDYFVERLHDDTIERLAGSFKGADKVAIDRIRVSKEPRYQNLEVLQNDLARDLFEELKALGLWDRARLSAKPLAVLDRFRLPTFAIIEQTIHADVAAALLPQLLRWYVNSFWADFHAAARVLVFLHLRCSFTAAATPARDWLDRFRRLARKPATAPLSQTQVESLLWQAFPQGRANLVPDAAGAPVKVLPQLAPIQPNDIKNWLRRFFEPRYLIDRTAQRLFEDVLREFGDTRLGYFYRPLNEFQDGFTRTQFAERRLPQRTR
jgi:hypothetical protein